MEHSTSSATRSTPMSIVIVDYMCHLQSTRRNVLCCGVRFWSQSKMKNTVVRGGDQGYRVVTMLLNVVSHFFRTSGKAHRVDPPIAMGGSINPAPKSAPDPIDKGSARADETPVILPIGRNRNAGGLLSRDAHTSLPHCIAETVRLSFIFASKR